MDVDVDPGGVANLNRLWDWEWMPPCMGLVSPVHAYSLWAGLCPEKLVKHSGTFANCKYEELPYPKNQKMCDAILVTL